MVLSAQRSLALNLIQDSLYATVRPIYLLFKLHNGNQLLNGSQRELLKSIDACLFPSFYPAMEPPGRWGRGKQSLNTFQTGAWRTVGPPLPTSSYGFLGPYGPCELLLSPCTGVK